MYKKFFKRFFDIIFSFSGLVLLSPLLLVVGILIKATSRGPVIFKQERIGKNGKVFNIYKFRSMCVGAEKMEGGVYCVKGDSRVTRIGRFIRATSIDELPQFWNIIKGDMSLIGPRPVLTYYPKRWEEYTVEELVRFNVRPGVTGWAAVHGRKTNTVKERFGYDNYYVENLSFGLDVKIFFMTVRYVLTNEGNDDKSSSDTKNDDCRMVENAEPQSVVAEEAAITGGEISEVENNH